MHKAGEPIRMLPAHETKRQIAWRFRDHARIEFENVAEEFPAHRLASQAAAWLKEESPRQENANAAEGRL